jgi:dTDP-glucose pyrophosphorylase
MLDYAIYDALRADFDRVVFVIRRDIEESFRASIGRRVEKHVDVTYVFQGDAVPATDPAPMDRERLWGTGHAVLSAIDVIYDPFTVINADDFYGRESFAVISEHLRSDDYRSGLVGFSAHNSVSPFGPVKRGLCKVSKDSLQQVTEVEIYVEDDGGIKYIDPTGVHHSLTGNEVVSMGMWGFYPEIFSGFRDQWLAFVRDYGQSQVAEFYVPSAVNNLINQGKGSCRVLETPDSWFGVTYPADREFAVERIKAMTAKGIYPTRLWQAGWQG